MIGTVLGSRNEQETSSLIKEAYDKAGRQRWIEAAELCQQAISSANLSSEPFILSGLVELSAECYLKGAFQAKKRQQFEELVTMSKQANEKACIAYDGTRQVARSQRARTNILVAEFWLSKDPTQRAILARKIVDQYQESARAFEDSGESKEALRTQIDQLTFFQEFINLSTDFQSLKKTFDQAATIGNALLDDSRKQRNDATLIEALGAMVWLYAVEAQVVVTPSEFQRLACRTRDLQHELVELSGKTRTPIALASAAESTGHVAFDLDGDPARAVKEYEKSLEIVAKLDDSLATGRLYWMCSQATSWLGYAEYDPEKRRRFFRAGEALALNAIRNLEISFQTTELSVAHTVRSKCLFELASLVGSDLPLKKKLLREAIDAASKGSEYESATWAWSQAAHNLSKALYSLARLEAPERRSDLLREALSAREGATEVNEKLFPSFWNTVANLCHLAIVRAEIATYESDYATKKDQLTRAVSEMELCLKRGEPWGTNPGFLQQISNHNETYGEILSKLHTLTGDLALAQRAIKANEAAINCIKGSKSPTVARLRWKIASVHNDLRAFQQASIEFKKAADNYREAASLLPGSAPLFEDIGHYLDAWSVIEAARLQHDEAEYLLASEQYSTAARLLGESREWSHLSRLFSGRSLLEKGEGLSGEERHSEAIASFKAGIDQFREEAALLEKKLQETKDVKEKGESENWIEIARERESHCRARLELEEARVFDKNGDKRSAARKFHSASEMFNTLASTVSDVQDKAELDGLAKFCDGWAGMKEAEAKASPELYGQAAESFLRLRSTQTKGQFLHLAIANAAICKALGAGVQFQQTRDAVYYAEVKKQTEAAAESFKAAGFRKTEAWTRATQRLFDSLIFITDAESERDPARKTELYHLAENHLEFAAKLYGEAGFPTRKEEALGHLERIREEKRVLLAPLEALSQIPTATAASLSLLPRGRGQPMGTQRFDEAYVVGDMTTAQREIPLGTTFVLDLEIVNVGKTPATLVNLQNMLPDGFELVSEHDSEVSLEGKLDLKGKNLEHLKTHAVKIPLRAIRNGTSELRPRLFYVDDSGTIKTYQFRPTTVTVLDVGLPSPPIGLVAQAIPSTPSLGEELRFDTERSRQVFQRLVREFLVDYMSRRLYVDKAGWRTLVQIVRETKIPRSALYGPRGREGPVLAELERRGLVESRIFPKERGRGGAVKRVRVAYDNAIVKRIVERSVLENK